MIIKELGMHIYEDYIMNIIIVKVVLFLVLLDNCTSFISLWYDVTFLHSLYLNIDSPSFDEHVDMIIIFAKQVYKISNNSISLAKCEVK